MSGTGITDVVRAEFDACLAGADEDGALGLAVGLVASGLSAEEVLLGLVAPAQVTVGEKWASGEWTVAREHAATHVSRRTVDAVAAAARGTARTPAGAGSQGHVLVACSDGEWHVLPSHILAEVLRLRGFHVRSLGGDVSPYGLLSDVHQNGPDLVALSCTLPWNLPRAHRQIETCRSAGVPVMAGGPGFGPEGMWAYPLGADLYAADARRAAEALLSRWPPELRGESSVQAGAVEAYAMLVRQHPGLLEHSVCALRDGFPGLRGRSGVEHEEDAEFVGRLLDSLAAAVFMDDERVFTGQLAFAAGFLTARSVDPGCLREIVDALAGRLSESPRALEKLSAGRRWLAEQGEDLRRQG
ncbi:cobalamin-binding protein [Streptomyces abyssalis]|uniref:Cobalamin-binding protein n=1 Tax=Streptomyces abyssalis TaxID=933944 RepID=A0A1E7JG00_9ACTN|nr:cobalamin B12-binding domain-containing protein [Streptomyces abyssalis]OEU85398.1 cobalamin-binding protein [Streptomyces abyssalis]OEU93139.1 cobalamin-binding protein [Streptomyces abyssalis]OEV30225.1 cobalamin-binding protein [Streptomyces nanshensis]